MDVVFLFNPEVEFDEAYSEIDFILSKADSDDSPLNNHVSEVISWPYINQQCQYLLSKGLDFRVLLWKLRADLNSQGFSSLWSCLKILEQAFIHFKKDDLIHLNPAMSLLWLTGGQCLSAMKAAKLIPSSFFTLEQLHFSKIDSNGSNSIVNFSDKVTMLDYVNKEFNDTNLPSLNEQLYDGLRILDIITERINSLPDGVLFKPIRLQTYLKLKLESLQEMEFSKSADLTSTNEYENNIEPSSGHHLNNRGEAVLMLDTVLAYFDKHEPSHPAPVLIRRAKKMIGMDFAEIIEELLPEAVTSLQQFAGKF